MGTLLTPNCAVEESGGAKLLALVCTMIRAFPGFGIIDVVALELAEDWDCSAAVGVAPLKPGL